ncbi:hypothetical protein ES705_45337 [subsurface metagenome]
MSMEHFKLVEFSSVFNESSGMWNNIFVYNTVERDDDHHITYKFNSYKEVVSGTPTLAFTHHRTIYRRSGPKIRRPGR